MQQNAAKLTKALQHAPGFADVTNDMDFTSPSVEVKIDRDQAASHGVSISSIETALGASFGGEQISTIYASDAEYWVMLELAAAISERHQRPEAALYLVQHGLPARRLAADHRCPTAAAARPAARRARVNTVVPLGAVTTMAPGTQALAVNHLGQLPAVTISFNLT